MANMAQISLQLFTIDFLKYAESENCIWRLFTRYRVLFVMLVHSSENFYAADSSGLAGNVSMLANEANRFWVAFYDGFVSRTCVPMVLSAFLLVPMKPEQTMIGFYKKRFLRFGLPLYSLCWLPACYH